MLILIGKFQVMSQGVFYDAQTCDRCVGGCVNQGGQICEEGGNDIVVGSGLVLLHGVWSWWCDLSVRRYSASGIFVYGFAGECSQLRIYWLKFRC